ncbi:MAG: helicase-related protein [Alphaproteobacteria bacterium]
MVTMLSPEDHSRVLAVLGPTNTGKTHFAVERMLAHKSGLIGFPLRLLAREIYDRIVGLRGAEQVALITGEEKIQPKTARYWVATVEAMPEDLDVDFLAVDEIQLAADRERGHVFTDRLLRARGASETMFLGADTIRPLLKRLVPEAEVITRPRFSTLSYSEPSKVTRLPKRSAVVAFTAREVYAFAELIRRQRGGAAVVLGSLSPRTRNAQVALYQEGEVDYLVATDAIGMGLNMDLGHVALASIVKFDGREMRELTPSEIGQIAGRAGRHMQDGTFGTTIDVGDLDPRLVESIENHDFPAIKELRWRHADLDFSSLDALLESLDQPPPFACLRKTGNALDHVSLKTLSRKEDVRKRAAGRAAIELLWSVCQIPDFRKTLTESHLHLLETVFDHLTARRRLPTDWVADQIARLERTEGDIDALTTRLAHIRTWTYMTHRGEWLEDAAHWQERARHVEDRLSDALHERLTQRFVDRRTQILLKSLQEGGPLGAVDADGVVMIEGQEVGRIEGLLPVLGGQKAENGEIERRAVNAAARKVIGPELMRRVRALVAARDKAFGLDDQGRILWREDGQEQALPAPVGRLRPGAAALAPRLEALVGDQLGGDAQEAVRRRLAVWLDGHLAELSAPLRELQAAELDGPARGIAFLLVEGLGNVSAAEVEAQVKGLSKASRRKLGKLGVRFGVRHVYLPSMLKAKAIVLRARLFAVQRGLGGLTPPQAGRVTLDATDFADGYAEAVGFERLGRHALRIDMVERLAAELRQASRDKASFELSPSMLAMTGLGREDLGAVVKHLGFADAEAGSYRRKAVHRRPKTGKRKDKQMRDQAASPFAALRDLRFKTGAA